MPPRYAYWTIIVDDQATAFRAGAKEDLLPTFNRLKEKHPSAKMMWFQNGKLWPSRLDAQEAMRARGELGRKGDERQGGFRDRNRNVGPPFTGGRNDRNRNVGPPFTGGRGERPAWVPKSESKPKSEPSERPQWKPKGTFQGKLEWTPKSSAPSAPEKRKWVPKEEYKKSLGIEAKKDKNWRPGGEHKDPRQKYKDAKKAKWSRFKQTVRKRWEGKPGKKGST